MRRRRRDHHPRLFTCSHTPGPIRQRGASQNTHHTTITNGRKAKHVRCDLWCVVALRESTCEAFFQLAGVATPPLPPPAPNIDCQTSPGRTRAQARGAKRLPTFWSWMGGYARGGAEQLSISGHKEAEGPRAQKGSGRWKEG